MTRMCHRRSVRTLALAMLAVSVLAGCGGSDETTTTGSTPSESADVELTTAFGSMDELPGVLTTAPPWPRNEARLQQRLRAIGLPALSAEGQVVHIHQHLDLFVDGKKVAVPANVGIGRSFISPLHTHEDVPSILHVESPTETSFSLGQVFAVWGVRLDARCIGSKCTGDGRQLRMWVDGMPVSGDPTRLVLAEHQQIVIAYGTPAQMPKDVPSDYDFEAAGL